MAKLDHTQVGISLEEQAEIASIFQFLFDTSTALIGIPRSSALGEFYALASPLVDAWRPALTVWLVYALAALVTTDTLIRIFKR
jgi:hypothetical protein